MNAKKRNEKKSKERKKERKKEERKKERKKENEILNGNIDQYATATNTLYKNYNSSK